MKSCNFNGNIKIVEKDSRVKTCLVHQQGGFVEWKHSNIVMQLLVIISQFFRTIFLIKTNNISLKYYQASKFEFYQPKAIKQIKKIFAHLIFHLILYINFVQQLSWTVSILRLYIKIKRHFFRFPIANQLCLERFKSNV